ncbi:hypothetical protein SAMN05444358_103306 [Ruegeria halocynthiae]|uniref:Uncharacterized protein n=1 Tax=Ruegeria halocynthiae TaxID=985054 RepID=A0A1H2ZNH7_9RHOB|nr:hypothetical protein SAMN05444358_103306 [Ruegeria halocynthiae]
MLNRAKLWENRANLCANTAQNYAREYAKFLNKINESNAALCAPLHVFFGRGFGRIHRRGERRLLPVELSFALRTTVREFRKAHEETHFVLEDT